MAVAGLGLYLRHNNNNKLKLALSMNATKANQPKEARYIYDEAQHLVGKPRLDLLEQALRKGSVEAGRELWMHYRQQEEQAQW